MKKQQIKVSNKYENQAIDNVQDFLNSDDFKKRRIAFYRITSLFEKNDVDWALACSANLFFRGIVDDFNDFDFIIDKDSVEKVTKIVKENCFGELIATGSNGFCNSDIYYHFNIFGDIDVDIISGFRVSTFGTSYYACYNKKEIEIIDLDYLQVPMIPSETLFILYGMMEGWQRRRRFKRELLYKYLSENMVQPEILKNAIQKYNLPDWLEKLSENLLEEK